MLLLSISIPLVDSCVLLSRGLGIQTDVRSCTHRFCKDATLHVEGYYSESPGRVTGLNPTLLNVLLPVLWWCVSSLAYI